MMTYSAMILGTRFPLSQLSPNASSLRHKYRLQSDLPLSTAAFGSTASVRSKQEVTCHKLLAQPIDLAPDFRLEFTDKGTM